MIAVIVNYILKHPVKLVSDHTK